MRDEAENETSVTPPSTSSSIEAEFRCLRAEILLRAAIQNLSLIITAVGFFCAIRSLSTPTDAWVIPAYFGASCGLAGVWALNDSLQIRMAAYLVRLEVRLEGRVGVGWEQWLKSDEARLSGPIRSGYQVTTRGFFLGSQLLLAGIIFATPEAAPSGPGAGVCLLSFIATVVVLVPPKIRSR